VLIAAAIWGERWIATPREALSGSGGVLFLLLNALSVFLIFLLVYLVGRNLVKLVFERRRGILGSRLNLKFVVAFGIMATVPTAVLFLVSSSIVSQSINTWFSLRIDRTLDESRRVGELYYQSAAEDALRSGNRIAEQIKSGRLLREENGKELETLVATRQRDYDLGVVQIFSATGEELIASINPDIPATHFSSAAGELVAQALEGRSQARVEQSTFGRVVRAAVPIASTFRSDDAVGAVVVNVPTPAALAASLRAIQTAHDDYRRIQPIAGDIERAYIFELLLFSLVVLLFAVWWGFRLAKGVTTPIRALAEGTAEVARGNLDVTVRAESDDEVGLLVDSFNRMTGDLKEARAVLEHTNAELERRRSYMEIVLRNTGAGVLSLDAEGRINTINPSAQRLLGIPPGSGLVGARLDDVLVSPAQRPIPELAARLRPGLRESIRRQVQLPAGEFGGEEALTLLVTVTLLKGEEGELLGRVVVLDDHSQWVKVQRMEAWQEVARRIAHEIKNPLTPIQLSAQRLRRRFRSQIGEVEEDGRVFDECVDAISKQVEGLKILVNEFSNFARLPEAEPKPNDLNRLLQEVATHYAGSGIEIRSDLDPAMPLVEIDAEQIARVLTNLLDNGLAAIRAWQVAHADQGGEGETSRIDLRTTYDPALRSARIEVTDNGIGISADDRRKIFEPYFSTKEQGSGLGLAIVSRIVADHRGYIRAHDVEPHGSRFVVELPAPGRHHGSRPESTREAQTRAGNLVAP
jgi:two-component system nitrogen regulation sensor histidine kinase NtrY